MSGSIAVENFEEIAVRKNEANLVENFFAVRHKDFLRIWPEEPRGPENLRKILFEPGRDNVRRRGIVGRNARLQIVKLIRDPSDVLRRGMDFFITQFIADEENNQHAAGNANGESGDIDERISLVLAEISQRDFEVVFEHGSCPLLVARRSL